jgi:hypothetical protein
MPPSGSGMTDTAVGAQTVRDSVPTNASRSAQKPKSTPKRPAFDGSWTLTVGSNRLSLIYSRVCLYKQTIGDVSQYSTEFI